MLFEISMMHPWSDVNIRPHTFQQADYSIQTPSRKMLCKFMTPLEKMPML